MKKLIYLSVVLSASAFAREIPKNEDYRLFLKQRPVTQLDQIAARNLNQSVSKLELWSGSYWPFYQGSLASRYRNEDVFELMNKSKQYKDYVSLRDMNLPVPMEELSPAEKYDLLMGDEAQTFTQTQWANGADNSTISGFVPLWRGICDGWAAAAMTWSRPVKPVTLTNPHGVPVTFYPEDIKALGSQLHAKGFKQVTFLGKRCRGGLSHLTGACRGTNSAALHLALVNSVGLEGKSFILDVSPNKEVWNYPVTNYKFTYSNPLSGAVDTDWKKVRASLEGNERDLSSRKRAKGTVWIVNVKAEVNMIDMRHGTTAETDGAHLDQILPRVWNYDIELDGSGRIIGGEWISSNGPDFMWAPKETSKPVSSVERNRRLSFSADKGITQALMSAAREASQNGQPLAVIVNELFKLSNQ